MRTNKPPNQLRIIAGRWRGRKLAFAPVPGLRPTPDRVRETLFNWLSPVIAGTRCLDLYAGSGALGLEAASRGAAEVVELDRPLPPDSGTGLVCPHFQFAQVGKSAFFCPKCGMRLLRG